MLVDQVLNPCKKYWTFRTKSKRCMSLVPRFIVVLLMRAEILCLPENSGDFPKSLQSCSIDNVYTWKLHICLRKDLLNRFSHLVFAPKSFFSKDRLVRLPNLFFILVAFQVKKRNKSNVAILAFSLIRLTIRYAFPYRIGEIFPTIKSVFGMLSKCCRGASITRGFL